MPKKNAYRISICLDERDRHIIEAATATGLSPTAFFRVAWNRSHLGDQFGKLSIPFKFPSLDKIQKNEGK